MIYHFTANKEYYLLWYGRLYKFHSKEDREIFTEKTIGFLSECLSQNIYLQ